MWKFLCRFFGSPIKVNAKVRQIPKEVSFLDAQAFDLDNWGVSFPADVNGSRIRCLISMEALQDHFGGGDSDPDEVFQANSIIIRETAKRMILNGRVKDGILEIRSSDFA